MFSADSCESFHPLSKKGKYIITAANNSKSSKGNSYVDMGFLFPGISRYFPVFPTALGNTLISRFIDNPGCKMKV